MKEYLHSQKEKNRQTISNSEVASVFSKVADILQIKRANEMEISAYRSAAMRIAELEKPISEIAEGPSGTLEMVPGFGTRLAEEAREIAETGRSGYCRALESEFRYGILELLSVEGVSPAKLRTLLSSLEVQTLEQLKRRCHRGDIASLEGFGDTLEERILDKIVSVLEARDRWSTGVLEKAAAALSKHLKSVSGIQKLAVAGALRRGCESASALKLVACGSSPERIKEAFFSYPAAEELPDSGGRRFSIKLKSGMRADLYVTDEKSFGAALLFGTGSLQHIAKLRTIAAVRDMRLDEKGLSGLTRADKFIAGSSEKEIYERLGMEFIPPEMREDTGEVEAASEGRVPRGLLKRDDIKGDLHLHTTATDGELTIEEMINKAAGYGYEYIALTEHTGSLKVAGGLGPREMLDNLRKIRSAAGGFPGIKVLAGCEVDILATGELDMPDEVLREMDIVLAAVHSHFDMDRKAQTERIMKALSNPFVDVLAHPTCRGIISEEGIRVDTDMIFAKSAARDVALEINPRENRFDLGDADVRRALSFGGRFSVGTDSHCAKDLNGMRWGVAAAKRAWVEKSSVVNALSYKDLTRWLRDRKKRTF